jgi:hypothetical protein
LASNPLYRRVESLGGYRMEAHDVKEILIDKTTDGNEIDAL